MSESFVGEIRMFAGNFALRGWSYCNGQLLPVAQNTALFSLVGTTCGGDGRTTFGLPDLQDRLPMHAGRGPGLSDRRLGERSGVNDVTLTSAQAANHRHSLQGANAAPTTTSPTGAYLANIMTYEAGCGNLVDMFAGSIKTAGASGAHNNQQVYLKIMFVIALQGLYPSRS